MEGRPIIREANLEQYRKHPGFAKSMDMEKPPEEKSLYPNPLDDLKNTAKIAAVMKNGRLYDAATLNETYPRQKTLDPQWWWKLEPPGAPARTKSRSGS